MKNLSLRSRLLLAVGAIAFISLVVADITVYVSLRSYLYRQVDATLAMSAGPVSQAAAHPILDQPNERGGPDLGGPPPSTSGFCQFGRESAPGMFIEVRQADETVSSGEECSAFVPGQKSYVPKLPATIGGFVADPTHMNKPTTFMTVASLTAGGPTFRVLAVQLDGGGTLVVADPISGLESTLRQLLVLEGSVTGGALVISVLLGLWLVRVGLRPLRDVVRTAEAISEGDLMHRVPNANTRTEVGHVATALNVMLGRIQTSFSDLQASENRLRRFVSDASHELRTPIAAVSAYAQLFKRGAAAHPEDLSRVMDGIERETARMGHLVEDLLLLARLDEHNPTAREPVELVGLAAEAIETARTVGPDWPLTFVADEPVEVMGDRDALRQVLDNLLANVRAHTPPGTLTTVTVGTRADDAFLEVADTGPGMTEDQTGLVFERFYRADPSRSRQTGGAGLGLAIVATIVRAHGGRTEALRAPGGGALFRVVLPLLPTSASNGSDAAAVSTVPSTSGRVPETPGGQ
ncbi:MAG TPA: HAMP domain-containing sensor histidine kinase [Acidimicrobiales bacterium]